MSSVNNLSNFTRSAQFSTSSKRLGSPLKLRKGPVLAGSDGKDIDATDIPIDDLGEKNKI